MILIGTCWVTGSPGFTTPKEFSVLRVIIKVCDPPPKKSWALWKNLTKLDGKLHGENFSVKNYCEINGMQGQARKCEIQCPQQNEDFHCCSLKACRAARIKDFETDFMNFVLYLNNEILAYLN